MTTLQLRQNQGLPYLDFTADSGITKDETFVTAILLSLLTDSRASESETQASLGGWWGNAYPDVEGWELGSKLWTLAEQKINQDTLDAAVGFAEEALAWLKEDGVTESIEVTVQRSGPNSIDFEIYISRPDEPAPRWLGTWDATLEANT